MTNTIERIEKTIEDMERNGVTSYIFAVQFTPKTVSFVKVSTREVIKFSSFFKISNNRILFKATKDIKNVLKNYPVIFECATNIIENIALSDNRINKGHAAEIVFFNYDIDTVLKSKNKYDGIYNGEKVQLKTSLISWKGSKNNGTSNATIVE